MPVGRPRTTGSAARSGVAPYCQMTASKSSLGGGQRRVCRTDRSGPAAGDAVGVHARSPCVKRGTTSCPAMAPVEGQRAQRDDARAEAVDGVIAGDGGQRGVGFGRFDEVRRAPADQRQPRAVEEHGRAGVELQGVGAELERHAACVEARGGHVAGVPERVATMSWLRPPARGRMPTRGEAGVAQQGRSAGGGRQVRHRAGEVAVGLTVGEGAAQHRHGLGEPQVVAGPPQPRRGGVDLEHGEAPPGAQHPGALAQGRGQIGEIAQRVAAQEAVEGAGRRRGAGCRRPRPAGRACRWPPASPRSGRRRPPRSRGAGRAGTGRRSRTRDRGPGRPAAGPAR